MTLPKIRHSPGKMMGLEDDPAAFWVFVFFFRGKLAVKLFLGEGTLEVCVCVFPLPRHWFYLGQNLLVHQSLTSKHQVHRPEGLIEEPLSEAGMLAGF